MKCLFLLSSLAVGAFAATATPPASEDFAVVAPTLSSDTLINKVHAVKWNKNLTPTSFNTLRDAIFTAAKLTDDEKSKVTVELPDEKVTYFLIHKDGTGIEEKLSPTLSQEYTVSGEKFSSSTRADMDLTPSTLTEVAYIVVVEFPKDAPQEAITALGADVTKRQLDSGMSMSSLQELGAHASVEANSKGLSLAILNGDKVSELVDAIRFYEDASATVNEKTYKFTVTKKSVFGGYKVTFPSYAYGVGSDIRKTVEDKGGFSDLEALDIAIVTRNREAYVWIAEGAKQDAMTAAAKTALEGDVKGFFDVKMKATTAPTVLSAPAVNDGDSGSGSLLIIIIIVVVIIVLAAAAAAVAFFMMKRRDQKTIQVAPAAETA